jgi:hypothetical protein
MKQKTLHALDGISEEYIKPLEASSKPLASERVVSLPQIKKTRQEGGETGIYHQFGRDLNKTKDR